MDFHQQPLEDNYYSADVSIEPNHEFEIQEIKYDGEEIYKEPLSQSENLALLISKIDFNEGLNLSYAAWPSDCEQNEEQSKNNLKNSTKQAQKFHRNIYDKIKQAHDETCVLLDCLQIVSGTNGGLLSLEPGRVISDDDSRFNDINDKALNVQLKKKNIDAAKCLIKKFLDKIVNETHDYNNAKFHIELYRLRLFWRLKKIGAKFIGDFGYRTIGSIHALKANFEVIKKDNLNNDRKVDVIIPEEYEDDAYIRVKLTQSSSADIEKNVLNNENTFSIFKKSSSTQSTQGKSDTYWYYNLENAQDSLYAKEVFNQLLREAFEMQTQLKTIIIGNSIELMVNPTVNLTITLQYKSSSSVLDSESTNNENDHDNYLLEYLLNQSLRKNFHQNLTYMDLRPITSVLAYNYKIKHSGITYSREHSAVKKISLLQNLKDITEHILIKNKVLDLLNEASREVGEPLIYIEPFLYNTSTNFDIQLSIISSFYENISKFNYYIKIRNTKVFVISDTNTIDFSNNVESIKSYFLDQACLQQIKCIEYISKMFDWQIIANGQIETECFQSSVLLLWNNLLTKKIAIKIGPVNTIEIHVNKYESSNVSYDDKNNTSIDNKTEDENDRNLNNLETYLKLIASESNFHKVDLMNSYPGHTLINKYELFLADIAITN